MSNAVRLSSKLGKDEVLNGLDSIAEELVANPDRVVFAYTWFTVPKVTRDVEHGTEVPTIQIRRSEPQWVDEVPQYIIDHAAKLEERRTGRAPLPFQTIETVEGRAAFGDEDEQDDIGYDEEEGN